MSEFNPATWLEYGTTGAALLLVFMSFGFNVWLIKIGMKKLAELFSLLLELNKTIGQLSAQLKEEIDDDKEVA